ncbi:MAG: EexN family lipoprotein [Pseudomonadota bacterium]
MKYATFLVLIGLAACSPEPRDPSWFEANPAEAKKVVEACAAGARSNECENARTGLARVKANARMERYRKGFE